MITSIKKITSKIDKKTSKKYYVLYFDYLGELRFTYLTLNMLKYFRDIGLTQLMVGTKLNVLLLKDKIHFKIISITND